MLAQFFNAKPDFDKTLRNSLSQSAEILSNFLKNQVSIVNYKFSETSLLLPTLNPQYLSKKEILLRCDIKGDVHGSSYLLLSNNEAHLLTKHIMPNLNYNDPDYQQRQEAILLEVSNIMTGSILTDLSNQLQIGIIGGIPAIHKNDNPIKTMQTMRLLDGADFPLCLSSNYAAENEFFNPVFISMFEMKFLTLLENKN